MKKALKVISLALAMVCCAVMFIACVPANPEKAEEKLEKKGYTVVLTEVTEALANYAPEGCEYVVYGSKDGEIVAAYYFDKASNAKDYYKELKEEMDDEEDSETILKKSGKVVVAATSKQAWKDFN